MTAEEKVRLFSPHAVAWVEQQEQRILQDGSPLTELEISTAKQVGVVHPERVRVLEVITIPMPDDPALYAAGVESGLISAFTSGMAMRYGIYLRADIRRDRNTLVHELAHTAQYERLGGIAEFLNVYLTECLTVGYSQCSLECEAIAAAEKYR